MPIFPPLIISKEIMDAGIEILESTIKEINEEYGKL
jgi:4-aminobutyrate aminotransferase-like enzyme